MNKAKQTYSTQPLGRVLAGIGRSFLNAVNTKLNHLDIERNYYALILIGEGKGMITQQDLADLLNSDKVSIVRIIDYLSGRGYVKRSKDPVDKRKYRLTLTDKAEMELPLIRNTIDEVVQKALKGLSDDKIETFYETLNIIKNNMN
jgi:MarR family transcriptional regulator for hemolysin